MKSSARIIGAGSLSELAAELESLGDEGRLEEIRQKTPALLADYRRLEKALDFLQRQPRTSPPWRRDSSLKP